MNIRRLSILGAVGALALLLAASEVVAQKYGGVLRIIGRSNPPSLSIHEEATTYTVMPCMPVYNNLVLFDPLQPRESMESIIPELATSWFWSNDNKALTFKLRRGVKWHDGRPFTSKDVKHTFDVVRGVAEARLKLNPRKLWYGNVQEITTNGDFEVTFKLERPQPSLVVLLASGYSPVYPAHVHPRELRTSTMGTGPFLLVSFKRDSSLVYKKNRDYFVRGRPYLDGIEYIIIRRAVARNAALQANQVDMSYPYEYIRSTQKTIASAVPELVWHENASNVSTNIIVNTRKPPFDDPKLRLVASLALDRRALLKGVYENQGLVGGAMLPKPNGVWGLDPEDLANVPGMGDGEANKEKAREIMRSLGYGPDKPLKVTLSTRALKTYTDPAIWSLDQFKAVWMDVTLEQVESGNWHAKIARRDYQIAMNRTGVGADEPDINFFENYTCGSQRNYSDYCNPDLEKKMVEQSSTTDFNKRLKLVHEIDLTLQIEGARPILWHSVNSGATYPYVKNYRLHQVLYNPWRMQEIWLDK